MEIKQMIERKAQELQYSNSNLPRVNNSNSTVNIAQVFANLTDLIAPGDPYMPFYLTRYKELGYKRFVELANKARAGATKKPAAYLFFWMLKNNELVK